ncbi:MAG: ATP-binding cassette domain-containing protein, partial [Spirochaetaceae bacterium]|nr:ATP-binding cassette domain-containing protein [Spirochaetaceae bacterium]
MAFIQFTGLSLAFGERNILKNCNLFLKSGCKAALCGSNGSGKSTLLKVISGEIKGDGGDRAIEKGCRVSYLPQSGIVHRSKTLYEEVETAFYSIKLLIEKSESIGNILNNAKEGDADTAALLLEQN